MMQYPGFRRRWILTLHNSQAVDRDTKGRYGYFAGLAIPDEPAHVDAVTQHVVHAVLRHRLASLAKCEPHGASHTGGLPNRVARGRVPRPDRRACTVSGGHAVNATAPPAQPPAVPASAISVLPNRPPVSRIRFVFRFPLQSGIQ
jgi:hypothetical protein